MSRARSSSAVEDAAHGIRQVANVNMARAIRAVTVERGKDPRDLALMAFGGGGPLHAVDVARLLGIRRVLISPVSGVFSAAGMLAAEAVHEFIRPLLAPLAAVKQATVQDAQKSMAAEGRAALAVEGYGEGAVQLRYAADLRYLGQSSQLTVPMPQGPQGAYDATALHAAFERLYRETFGYTAEGEPVELVNLRLSAIGTAASRLDFGGLRLDARALAGESGERLVSFGRGEPRVKARLLPRAAVGAGPGRRPRHHRELRHHHRGPARLHRTRRGRGLHRHRDGGDRCLRPRARLVRSWRSHHLRGHQERDGRDRRRGRLHGDPHRALGDRQGRDGLLGGDLRREGRDGGAGQDHRAASRRHPRSDGRGAGEMGRQAFSPATPSS